MTDRAAAERVLTALRQTPVGGRAVLIGSSGLFGFETRVPALTEDVDIAVEVDIVEREGPAIVEQLARLGFSHEHGTASFVSEDGTTFDLLGQGDPALGDHIGGAGVLRVMVFEDVSRIVADPRATASLPGGGRALTPAGFVASKLLTERAHKGSKDKIQALLVIAERTSDHGFLRDVVGLLRLVDPIRIDDLQAAAQDAFLALSRDPAFADAGAEGYVATLKQAEEGLSQLALIVGELHG